MQKSEDGEEKVMHVLHATSAEAEIEEKETMQL